MKKIIALICLCSFSLSSMASSIAPLSTHFFLQTSADDRDTVRLVECFIPGNGEVSQENCQEFGNKEGYSLTVIERLQLSGKNSERMLTLNKNVFSLSLAASVIMAMGTAKGLQQSFKNKSRGDIVATAIFAGFTLVLIGVTAVAGDRVSNHFDPITYKHVGNNIFNLDHQEELEQAETVLISVGSVERGPGGERAYNKAVKKMRNALVHLLKEAKL